MLFVASATFYDALYNSMLFSNKDPILILGGRLQKCDPTENMSNQNFSHIFEITGPKGTPIQPVPLASKKSVFMSLPIVQVGGGSGGSEGERASAESGK